MSSTRTYGAGVRVGNWNEDKCHQEERIAQFLEKRKSGDLSFMKTTQRVKSATEPMPQNCSAAGVLSFGDSIVLANTVGGSVLSSLPLQDGESDSMDVSGSEYDGPTMRNVFTVLPVAGGSADEVVKYGDRIMLSCASNMYLSSDRPFPGAPVARFSGQQAVKLNQYDAPEATKNNCVWVIDPADAATRPEYLGTPVPTDGTAILVRHSASNELLCCLNEQRKKLWSEYGVEIEITCNTGKVGMIDGEFVAKEDNHWKIVTGTN